MILAGMNVARCNFSHGDFATHRVAIRRIRSASQTTGCRIAVIAGLPGPKMRIGQFAGEPVELKADDLFTPLTWLMDKKSL